MQKKNKTKNNLFQLLKIFKTILYNLNIYSHSLEWLSNMRIACFFENKTILKVSVET